MHRQMNIHLLKEWLEFFTRKCFCKVVITKKSNKYYINIREGINTSSYVLFPNFKIENCIDNAIIYQQSIMVDFIKTAMELTIIGNKPDFGYLK